MTGKRSGGGTRRYWCAVACQDHVQLARQGGFAQVCHGKRKHLRRMRAGDGIVYYSPSQTMGGKARCQRFTAIGTVKDERIYLVQVSPEFSAYRRDVFYFNADSTSIRPLLQEMSFTAGRDSWGYRFRLGLFEIERQDFELILSEMVPPPAASRTAMLEAAP